MSYDYITWTKKLLRNNYTCTYNNLILSKIGITGRSLKVASNHLQTTAQYASSRIWSRSFHHEGNTRGTTIPM